MLVPNPAEFIALHQVLLWARDDWELAGADAANAASLLNLAGPGSWPEARRQYLSTYGEAHYGDDPAVGLRPLFETCWSALETLAGHGAGGNLGPVLDVGCAVGRATFEAAARTGSPTLGLDLNISMLQVARRAAVTGIASYPLRTQAMDYARREVPLAPAWREADVEFRVADAGQLPLTDGVVGTVLAFNLVDCLTAPTQALTEWARVLRPGGRLVLTTPHDWSAAATPPTAWLLGPDPLRAAAETAGLVLECDLGPQPWRVRVHDRHTADYRVDAWILRKLDGTESGNRLRVSSVSGSAVAEA